MRMLLGPASKGRLTVAVCLALTSPVGAETAPAAIATAPLQYPAPPWIDAVLPMQAGPAEPSFLLMQYTTHRRVLRAGQPWCSEVQLGMGRSIVRAEPAKDDAIVTVFEPGKRALGVLRCRPSRPAERIVESDVGAAVRGDSLLYARGAVVFERHLDTGAEQVRQRFPAGQQVERVDAFGERALVLLRKKEPAKDVYVLGARDPVLRDVEWGSAVQDGWVVHVRGTHQIVDAEGRVHPLAQAGSAPPVSLGARPPLSLEERNASAVISLSAEGTVVRRSPWVVDVEGYDVHRAMRGEVLPAHRLQVVRSVDGTAAAWRESPSGPWRSLDGAAVPWGTAKLDGDDFRLDGLRLLVRSNEGIRWFLPSAQGVAVVGPTREMRPAGPVLWWLSVDNVWMSRRFDAQTDASSLPPHTTVHAGHTLTAEGGTGVSLDGRALPFRWPSDLRGYFGVQVDGVYPVPETPYVLLNIGRQSAHGGHVVRGRVLAVDVRDGSVRLVGPADASPIGFDTRANFHRFRTVAASPRGLWMQHGSQIVLAPLDGSTAVTVGTQDPDSWTASASPDSLRLAFVQAGRVVVSDAERRAVVAQTRVLQTAGWQWAPTGHALVVHSAAGLWAIDEQAQLRRLGCSPEPGNPTLREVLPDARAALLCQGGQLAVAGPDRCTPIAHLACHSLHSIGWGATWR